MTTLPRTEYYKHFERRTRSDGSSFYALVDNAPEDLSDLIREIHHQIFGGCWANDWIYDQILDAFEDLSNNNIDNLNIEADCYTHDLLKWLREPFALEICEEVREELCPNGTLTDQISWGQWFAKKRIYEAVDEFINAER